MNYRHNLHPDIVIDWFDNFGDNNYYDFLSNFYTGAPFIYRGVRFHNSEQAFAFYKIDNNSSEAVRLRDLMLEVGADPGAAKSLGRTVPLRPDWDIVKFSIMRDLVHEKFFQNSDIAQKLIDTGNAYLQEGTYWNDRIWGVDITASDNPLERPGWNMLGSILMETRALLLAEQKTLVTPEFCATCTDYRIPSVFHDCPIHENDCYYTECPTCSKIDSDCGEVLRKHIYTQRFEPQL